MSEPVVGLGEVRSLRASIMKVLGWVVGAGYRRRVVNASE